VIRLATYNVEWFTALFNKNNALLDDGAWSARYNVTRSAQISALKTIFRAINADAVMVIEATRNSAEALLNFAESAGLRLNAVVHGFESDTQQEIAFLYDNRTIEAAHDPWGEPVDGVPAPRFDHDFAMDVDMDGRAELHRFSKPPLELQLTIRKSGKPLRLIGVHAKSKAPHDAKSEKEAVRIAIANRRRQLAQCLWLRRRVVDLLDADHDLIVMGDFNDGPGLDEYEQLFGKSGVEVVIGSDTDPAKNLFDPHAIARVNPRDAWSPATARFYDRENKRYFNALLDFVMVSHRLAKRSPNWRIWHPFDDALCFEDKKMCEALLTASDHYPVTLDLP